MGGAREEGWSPSPDAEQLVWCFAQSMVTHRDSLATRIPTEGNDMHGVSPPDVEK